MSDTGDREPDGEQLDEVKSLDAQLEELRQKGVPCPHCARPIEWKTISDAGKAEILTTVESGKPHEKFYGDRREDCQGAKTRAQFLRRIAKGEDGTLTLVTLTSEQVLAELRDSRATVAELQESGIRLATALEIATAAKAEGLTRLRAELTAKVGRITELEEQVAELESSLERIAGTSTESTTKDELIAGLEKANETLRQEAGLFRALVLEIFKLAGMEIKGGEKMTEEKKAGLILTLGDALRDSRFLTEVLELTGWDKDGLLGASQKMAARRGTKVVQDPSEAPTRVGPAPQPPSRQERPARARTGLGGWVPEGISALFRKGRGRPKGPDIK